MPIQRTRKNKENAHYGFLVSWSPDQPRVKGELGLTEKNIGYKPKLGKSADLLAQDDNNKLIKSDIIKSLIRVGFILILELVIYFAWSRFRTI